MISVSCMFVGLQTRQTQLGFSSETDAGAELRAECQCQAQCATPHGPDMHRSVVVAWLGQAVKEEQLPQRPSEFACHAVGASAYPNAGRVGPPL